MTPSPGILHASAPLIRRVRPDDLEALVELCREHAEYERSAYRPEGKAASLQAALFGDTPRLHAWIAMEDGVALGYSTATPEFSTWAAREFVHMDCLFVREAARNRGLGQHLLMAVVTFAREAGFDEVQWQTPRWNHDAIRFYRRNAAVAQDKVRFRLGTTPSIAPTLRRS